MKYKTSKKNKNLIENSNFRNNQNYAISESMKYEFSNRYYDKVNNILLKIISYLLISIVATYMFWTLIEKYIPISFVLILFASSILILFTTIIIKTYIVKPIFKSTYNDTNKKFNSNRFIFRKKIRKNISRWDYIAFKK